MPLIRIGFEGGFMSIRSVAAAAVMAAGIGQAADAAVLESGFYKVEMTLDENYWWCYSRSCEEPEPAPAPYQGLNLGDRVEGYFGFHLVSPGILSFSLAWNDGAIFSEYSRWGNFYRTDENSYYNSVFEQIISFELVNGVLSGMFTDSYYHSGTWDQYASISFQEVEVDVAPVPLPATAALLPFGLGALAMMRKRRKQAGRAAGTGLPVATALPSCRT